MEQSLNIIKMFHQQHQLYQYIISQQLQDIKLKYQFKKMNYDIPQLQKKEKEQCMQSLPAVNRSFENTNTLKQRYFDKFRPEYLEIFTKKFEWIDFVSLFANENIVYNTYEVQQPQLKLSLLKESINSEVMELQARWGHYKMVLTVLNVLEESSLHRYKCFGGSYGNVYMVDIAREELAIKCIHFAASTMQRQAKMMAIKQYFLLRLCSVLKIGPQVKKWLGFDLIMHQNCIQFGVQICQVINTFDQELQIQLLQSLWLMHRFQIIHFDIKPQNLMFHSGYDKIVFIDFGLSELVDIHIGQTTPFFFRGTLDYCSPQMVEMFTSSEKRQLDPYFNDLHSLHATIQLLNHRTSKFKIQQGNDPFFYSENNKENISSMSDGISLLLFRIKWFLYSHSIQELIFLIDKQRKYIKNMFMNDILNFMFELQPSSEIKKIYNQYIDTHQKDGIDYLQINEIYSSSFSEIRSIQPNQLKRDKYKQLSQGLFNNSSEHLFQHEPKIIHFLTQKVIRLPEWVRFKVYIEYISFSNNVYGLNIEKRGQITRKFNDLIFDQEDMSDSGTIDMIKKTILKIFRKTISFYPDCNAKDKPLLIKLIYELIEHFFILNIGTVEELEIALVWMYQALKTDYSEKIIFLLKIKHNRIWLRNQLAGRQWGDVYQLEKQIFQWCIEKMQQIRTQANNDISIIANYLQAKWTASDKSSNCTLDIQKTLKFRRELQLQILFDNFEQSIKQQRGLDIEKKLQGLYLKMNLSQKKKSYYFHFDIYSCYLNVFDNYQKGIQILQLFKKNLMCEEIMENLVLSYMVSYINHQLISYWPIFCQNFAFFVKSINRSFVQVHHQILKDGMLKYAKFNAYNDKSKQLHRQIVQKLKKISDFLDFRQLAQNNCASSSKGANCVTHYALSNYMVIKNGYHHLAEIYYDWEADMLIIKEISEHTTCPKCSFAIRSVIQLESQHYLLQQLDKKPELLQKIMESNDRFNDILKDADKQTNIGYFKKLNKIAFYKLCSRFNQYEKEMKGISQLHVYLYQQNLLSYYLDSSDSSMRLFQITLNSFQTNHSQQEAIKFMMLITDYANQNYMLNCMYHVFEVFSRFFNKYQSQFNFIVMYEVVNRQAISSSTIFNVLYYYFLLFYVKSDIIMRIQSSFVRYLPYLPLDLRLKFLGHYYRFLLCYNSCNKLQGTALFNQRKEEYLTKLTIKVFRIFDYKPLNFRKKRFFNLKKQLLYCKLLLIGGPYNLNMYGVSNLSININTNRRS